jgi:hypothetical protein
MLISQYQTIESRTEDAIAAAKKIYQSSRCDYYFKNLKDELTAEISKPKTGL